MSEEKISAPKSISCPVLMSRYPILPGEKVELTLEGGQSDFLRELTSSNKNKIFIKNPYSTMPLEGKPSKIGTIALVTKITPQPDGSAKLTIEGQSRGMDLQTVVNGQAYLTKVVPIEPPAKADNEFKSYVEELLTEFSSLLNVDGQALMDELREVAKNKPFSVADKVAHYLKLAPEQKEELVQTLSPNDQLEIVAYHILDLQMGMQMNPANQQSGAANEQNELDVLAAKIATAGMTEEAQQKCEKELIKLRKMNPQDPTASKVEEYLDRMVSIPWKGSSEIVEDLQQAQNVLDEDHYGLNNVKDRIIEQLAVQQQTGKVNGSIMLLVGPPGVGKTSIGKSLARATGRKFVRVSLGGVHDESTIRGHRTTYVGSTPGKIMDAMKEAGTINPIIMLDEIDKLSQGNNSNGDPTAALLEVLDPAQNNTYVDQYLGVKYDLSNVMFVCTANELGNIPGPLRDRMELIQVDGYTDEEKMQIGKRYLVKKEMEEKGLSASQFSVSDEALAELIDGYTREAGVRTLEREIGKLARKVVRQIVQDHVESVAITPENLEKYAGPKKVEHKMADKEPHVGQVNGLAVAGAGGCMLPLRAVKFKDPSGGVEVTGSLKDVMKESVSDAYAYVRAHADELGIPTEMFLNYKVHIKVDDGATPKDGPSAGLALATLITSILTDIPIRADVAMTGEISVLGESMPIGGLKQKLLGAQRAGIKTALFPVDNMKDLAAVPAKVKQELELIPVGNAMEVLKNALVRMPEPLAANENLVAGNNDEAKLREQILSVLAGVFNVEAKVPANDVTPHAVAPQKQRRAAAQALKVH